MRALLVRFLANESGATAIEYGLIAAMIAAVCIAAMGHLVPRACIRIRMPTIWDLTPTLGGRQQRPSFA